MEKQKEINNLEQQIAQLKKELEEKNAYIEKIKRKETDNFIHPKHYSNFQERYLDYFCSTSRILRTRGLLPKSAEGNTPIDIELQDIYVPLKITRRLAKETELFFEKETSEDIKADDSTQKEELAYKLGLSKDKAETPVSINELLKKDRAVLLGKVGSGKSTFFNYVTYLLSNDGSNLIPQLKKAYLPLLLSFRDIIKQGEKFNFANIKEFYKELLANVLLSHLNEDPNFFINNLLTGNFLILFDGMDEIADFETRDMITQWIRKIVQEYPNNKFFVSSRPVEYTKAPLSSLFEEYDICDFDEEQISLFISQWYKKSEVKSYGLSEFTEIEANKKFRALQDALNKKEEIKRLAANPLLLTIMVIVNQYRGKLPERRIELYEECINVLLEFWEIGKVFESSIIPRKKIFVLKELAFRLHSKGKRDAEKSEILEIIKAPLNIVEPTCMPEDFLFEVTCRNMILEERNSNIYAFTHLSFQEYLAALYIREEKDDKFVADKISWKNKTSRLWWKEVALLYCSFDKDITPFLEYLKTTDDDIYLNNFFILCECLAHSLGCREEFRLKILEELIDNFYNGKYRLYHVRSGKLFLQFKINPSRDELVEILLRKLKSTKDTYISWKTMLALGNIGSEKAVGPLLDLLKSPQGLYGMKNVINALGKIGNAKAVESLIDCLKASKNKDIQKTIARALGQIGSETASVSLLDLLKSTKNKDIIWRATRALGFFRSEKTVEYLLDILRSTADKDVIIGALQALGNIGSETAAPFLIDLLKTSEDQDVILSTIDALGNIGSVSADPILRNILKSSEASNKKQILCATNALGKIGGEKAVEAILDLLKTTKDQDVIKITIGALGRIGSETAIVPLEDFLCLTEDKETINSIVNALGRIASEKAVPFLLDRLNKAPDWKVVLSIIQALGNIGSETAVPFLIDLLKTSEDKNVILRTAKALANIGSETAVPSLIDLLKISEDEDVILPTVKALGKIRSEKAAEHLFGLILNAKDAVLIRKTIKALGNIGGEKTMAFLKKIFYWRSFDKTIKDFILQVLYELEWGIE